LQENFAPLSLPSSHTPPMPDFPLPQKKIVYETLPWPCQPAGWKAAHVGM